MRNLFIAIVVALGCITDPLCANVSADEILALVRYYEAQTVRQYDECDKNSIQAIYYREEAITYTFIASEIERLKGKETCKTQ